MIFDLEDSDYDSNPRARDKMARPPEWKVYIEEQELRCD